MTRVFRKVKHVITSTWNYFLYVCKNNDFDWDFDYLYSILSWKIGKMKKNIGTRAIIDSCNRVTKQMDYALFLIDKLQDTSWQHDAVKPHNEKYGKIKFIRGEMEGGARLLHITFKKIPNDGSLESKALLKEANEEMEKIHNLVEKKHQDYKRRLFKHLDNYMEGWWD